MIVQDLPGGGLLLFRQTDHALLSGAFAVKWGSDALPGPPRPEQTVIAAARHDDGWSRWELAPTLRPDGRPVDFIGIPVDEHVELYRRGIDLVCEEDRFAGLVASLHGERLYTYPFHPGMDPRIDHLQGVHLKLAELYVRGERERQAELVESLGQDAARDAEEAWRLLQVWDRLSLLVCMQPITSAVRQTFRPVLGTDGTDVAIEVHGTDDGDLVLEPYPFGDDPTSFEVEALETHHSKWEDLATFRLAMRTATRRIVRFACRSYAG